MSKITAKSPSQVVAPKDRNRETHKDPTKNRNLGVVGLIERGGAGAGSHKNKQDFERGHARNPKHKGQGYEEGMLEGTEKLASSSSFSTAMHLWWSGLYDEFVAEATLEGWDAVLIGRPELQSMRFRLTPPELDDKLKHIQISMLMSQFGIVKTTVYVMEFGSFVSKKEQLFSVEKTKDSYLASRIFEMAMSMYEESEL